MPRLHWVGTGLSTRPGLRRLIENGHDVVVWNRTPAKAHAVLEGLTADVRAFDPDSFAAALKPGDVAVSMLPGDWHVTIAQACLAAGAHFVSSSYISPEMRSMDAAFRSKGLVSVNEVGLDPGIDHLMAHWLVADYRAAGGHAPANEITFRSYCGGVPKSPNPFRYKFSWSPLGVLKALRSPSHSIKDFKDFNVARPWDSLTRYDAPLPAPESFEVYPNRDSLPFIAEYGIDPDWRLRTFVRGTLRLDGWAAAWKDIFREIESLSGPEGEARLQEMSENLWQQHQFDEGEPDRVVMCVELRADRAGAPIYHKTYVMDASGDARGSAMARLVSVPVSLAVESVLADEIAPGVSAAPPDLRLVDRWLGVVATQAQRLAVVDHLA
ncbi:saccharopine dehydrogenase family protein [Fluviibacterium sp. DFM31]|uniref:Saccharopine dehydrogenase family protein n=1 Tax=Meridianimarinicoccus marinus TaxID=3231483 RepID=A0ABV3L5F6_9RHOB